MLKTSTANGEGQPSLLNEVPHVLRRGTSLPASETECAVLPSTPGEIPLSQFPQTGALDQQVRRSQGDQAVITIWMNSTGHEVAMCQMCMTCLKTGQGCLMVAMPHICAWPQAHSSSVVISPIFAVPITLSHLACQTSWMAGQMEENRSLKGRGASMSRTKSSGSHHLICSLIPLYRHVFRNPAKLNVVTLSSWKEGLEQARRKSLDRERWRLFCRGTLLWGDVLGGSKASELQIDR